MLHQNQYQTVAVNYLKGLTSDQAGDVERISDALIQTINNQQIKELDEQDFRLMLNQFFNLVCFGPVTHLELFLTENCNLDCDYCFVKTKRKKRMPLDTILSAVNFLSFYSGDSKHVDITLFGGEPLMEKDNILEAIKHISKLERETGSKQFSLSLTTNGTLLDEGLLEKTHGKINYLLSIDGDKETHDTHRKFRNGKGTFNNVVTKIGLLKQFQPWIGSRMTLTPKNIKGLTENVYRLHQLGINQFLLGPALDQQWDEASLLIYEDQLLKTARLYTDMRRQGAPIRITLFDSNNDCGAKKWGCSAGRNTLAVNTNGEIYPCSKFIGYEEFDEPELKLGSIYEGITNIPLRNKLCRMTGASFTACKGCAQVEKCAGGCPADNFFIHHDLHKPGHAHCAIKKIENRVKQGLSSIL
jgi:uncharacterized protein